MVEIETGRCRWHYYRRLNDWGAYDKEEDTSDSDDDNNEPTTDNNDNDHEHDDDDDDDDDDNDEGNDETRNNNTQKGTINQNPGKGTLTTTFPILSGARTTFFQRKDNLKWVTRTQSRSSNKAEFQYDKNVLVALEELAVLMNQVDDDSEDADATEEAEENNQHNNVTIELFTMLKVKSHTGRGSQIYYANPMDSGSPWYDWGMFAYNDTFRLGQMKAFIDFTDLPENNKLKKSPGIYILMEPAYRSALPEEQRLSEIFEPWVKQPSQMAGLQETHNHLLFVPLSDLKLPSCVVPDLGNSSNKRTYLRMVPRWQWPLMFDDWLEQKHRRQWDDDELVPNA